jgi:hypothetical protein
MTWQPLWQFFASQGIDASSLTPYPVQGPVPLTPKQLGWQLSKAKSRLMRTVAQAESGRLQPRAFQEKQVWATVARAKALIRYR